MNARISRVNANCAAASLREFVRLRHSSEIKSRTNLGAVSFSQRPISELSQEIRALSGTLGESDDLTYGLLSTISDRSGKLEAFHDAVKEYHGFAPERLLRKAVEERVSDLPARMLAVVGSGKKPTPEISDGLMTLGAELARNRVVVVTDRSGGYLEPFLQGFKDNGGLSFGIFDEKQVTVKNDSISEPSGLITFPIVGQDHSESDRRLIMALMSGRGALILGDNDESEYDPTVFQAVLHNAEKSIPAVLVGVPSFPGKYIHPLQTNARMEDASISIMDFIPKEENLHYDETYDYLVKDPDRMRVAVFCGTSYHDKHVEKELLHYFAEDFAFSGFVSITGAGPGPMADFAQRAGNGGLTVGITFFPTFLAVNPWIDIPIVSNSKLERSTEQVLSSNAVVNLGGSHATCHEMLRSMYLGRPVINCAPGFGSGFFENIPARRGPGFITGLDKAEPGSEGIASGSRTIMNLLWRFKEVGAKS